MKLRIPNRHHAALGELDVTLTASGWTIAETEPSGVECDRQGAPHLFDLLRGQSAKYPEALGRHMEHLWERAQDGSVGPDAVQFALFDLSKWIFAVHNAAPRTGLWEGC